jgi:hypothetical protein
MGKENVAHMYNGILLSLKKTGNLAICDNMNEFREAIMLSEINHSQSKY